MSTGPDGPPRKHVDVLLRASLTVAAVGLVLTAVFFFKPWASCDIDDVPQACPPNALEATMVASGLFLLITGLVGFCVWMVRLTRR
ncbi:hypothetical protein [Kineococcus xinjiangensis]|uniref:hypothetical protein n=1 Tax=Kineococcus xinjiangensis TaxID=512762 RepID=UPI0011B06A26|nr:hypothetical protein [Kineococcus xinjiangensis]